MKEQSTSIESASRVCYETMEACARGRTQGLLQDLLEAEVTQFLGRGKSQRQAEVAPARWGYRNGYGKRKRVALTAGTITVRRPRMRNLTERFESWVLPLFKRRTAELGALLPQLYSRMGSRAGISSWRCAGCWARGHRSRRHRWVGSRASGRRSMRAGGAPICRRWSWCTGGPTACT